jgi:hypothetical protein
MHKAYTKSTKKKLNFKNSYATYNFFESHLKERAFTINYGPIDVGLLSENQHQINLIACEDRLLNEGCCPPFVDHFLHCLVEWIALLSFLRINVSI